MMDTSEIYIKMCDCPELQEHKPDGGTEISCYIGQSGIARIHISKYGDYWALGKDLIWLSRQDQIQEIIPQCNCSTCLIEEFYSFFERNIEGLADKKINSMEQIWLAFYMDEKHSKGWNGKEWINKNE